MNTLDLNERQRDVLGTIASWGPLGAFPQTIEWRLRIPRPSVRRTVQELRTLGWNISFAGVNEPYRLAADQRQWAPAAPPAK